jgi:alkylated DNA repair dioxygenase AlkB
VPLPDPFLPWRARAAALAGVEPDSLEQILALEYSPGAGIGRRRDRPQFGIVAALSLLAPCRMRFRREASAGWDRANVSLAPRSGYVLAGEGARCGNILFRRSTSCVARSPSER